MKSSQDGNIYLQRVAAKIVASGESIDFIKDVEDYIGKLIIKESEGRMKTLYIIGDSQKQFSELPPLPPAGIFDIRYSNKDNKS